MQSYSPPALFESYFAEDVCSFVHLDEFLRILDLRISQTSAKPIKSWDINHVITAKLEIFQYITFSSSFSVSALVLFWCFSFLPSSSSCGQNVFLSIVSKYLLEKNCNNTEISFKVKWNNSGNTVCRNGAGKTKVLHRHRQNGQQMDSSEYFLLYT